MKENKVHDQLLVNTAAEIRGQVDLLQAAADIGIKDADILSVGTNSV